MDFPGTPLYPANMPIYETQCPGCMRKSTIWRKVEDRNRGEICPCGSLVERVISRPMIRAEITPFHSPTDGRLISSRKEWREDLSRSNAIPWEPGIEKDIARKGESEREKAFKPISDAVDSIVRDMNVSGKLENLNV